MRIAMITLACLVAAPAAAQSVDCTSVPQAVPAAASALAPIAAGFATRSDTLGIQSGVLSQAYDEAQTVDRVLLRMRIERCMSVAKAMPAPTAVDPNDPAAYKPKTEFDNTPWRFDMSQNGKRMTVDEFAAWMTARGVRVARGAAPAVVPAAAPAVVPAAAPAAMQATGQASPLEPVPVTVPAPPTP